MLISFTRLCCGWPKCTKKDRTFENNVQSGNQNQTSLTPGFEYHTSNANRNSISSTTSSNSNLSIAIIASSSLNPNSMLAQPQSSYHDLAKETHRRYSIEQDLPPSYEQVVTSNNDDFNSTYDNSY